MFGRSRPAANAGHGFLMRLLRDTRGNALVLMTAALIPLAGMVGGGIDVSRMYILKTRLQHACDAGALAGRKAMGGGTWSYNNNYAQAQANQFFDGNFNSGMFSSTTPVRQFTEAAGKVTGTASATIPMTLMRIFGKTDETLAVTCDAEMRLPNTDVMFVLDTTGSMADIPAGDTMTKMASLKVAVKCFYEIVARLDTDATCTTGTPSGGTGNQVQIRFGFVPYATNVNVGRLLKPEWFVDSWNYQTREALYTNQTNTSSTGPSIGRTDFVNQNPLGYYDYQGLGFGTASACSNYAVPPQTAFEGIYAEGPQVERTTTGGNPETITWATYQYGRVYAYKTRRTSGGYCWLQRQEIRGDLRRQYSQTDTTTTSTVFNGWRYAALPVNVGLLKNGTTWQDSFQWPIGANGSATTIAWKGCIEERDTVRQTSYDPIPSGAKDLDIDLVPDSAATRWKPALPDLLYARGSFVGWDDWTFQYGAVTRSASDNDYSRPYSAFCPQAARKLTSYEAGSDFDSYVNSLYPEGNTYHDIGLIWGARLMSPTGIFASENAKTATGGDIERHMIFMTDGDACAQSYDYTAYGYNWWDRRQTSADAAPTGGCTSNNFALVQQVNKRTEALCSAIKNKNISLWVVAFGTLAPETITRLTACASSGKYFTANNAAELQQTFKSIADQISQLRLTR
ncbi:hypothetical protein ASE86_08480 [Sphingomonas sp. Leaf33]|uniref:TadE/TadG family type IV pilus assembly protein n=1 Tax=Sphingomonas sp. Leaf33 TaxID=1736215 RepID=UPI0006FA7F99|nr:TadE/TadG family type IV pilus assembly protein [Sphingomonas sp. Leaf33]KQN26176.1 hypothetical protein ASE86_08480 [Sphingomonas sp. Leaf33]